MLHLFKRHPFPVKADFGHSLVLTYAFPQTVLQPLLPPGLVLDAHEGCGFVAIALVETRHLRPAFLPEKIGQDFFLCGYRIFTRLSRVTSALRGLYILRSDTDRRLMHLAGALFTHYRYGLCQASCESRGQTLRWQVRTPNCEADLTVTAELDSKPAPLPPSSPFANPQIARRFAGPLPYTFSYESQTDSIISVRGIRDNWDPQPVRVFLDQTPTFFRRSPFNQAQPMLANAFHLQSVPYRWDCGQRLENSHAEPKQVSGS
jgi:hypothetical protein